MTIEQPPISLEDSLHLPEIEIKDSRSLETKDKNVYGGTNAGVEI